jgi:hypothetical protein
MKVGMMIESKIVAEEPPVSKLKLMIVGHEKNGKTRLAATGRKPVLIHDHDNRSEALNGIPGVYVLSYVDPQAPKLPEASQDQLDILDQLEADLDISHLVMKGKRLFPNVPEGTILRTNVLDSIATLGRNFQNYAMYHNPGIRRDISFGKTKVSLPGGWDAWNAETKSVEPLIQRFLALPADTTVIMHESLEETPDSTPENKRLTGRVEIYPNRYQLLLKYFNEVWRVKLTQINGRYVPRVYPLPTYEFDCATALLLDPQEEPNIEAMISKHEARLKNGWQPSLPQTTTPQAQLPAPGSFKI